MTVEWVAIAAVVVVGAVAITYTVLDNLDPRSGADRHIAGHRAEHDAGPA